MSQEGIGEGYGEAKQGEELLIRPKKEKWIYKEDQKISGGMTLLTNWNIPDAIETVIASSLSHQEVSAKSVQDLFMGFFFFFFQWHIPLSVLSPSLCLSASSHLFSVISSFSLSFSHPPQFSLFFLPFFSLVSSSFPLCVTYCSKCWEDVSLTTTYGVSY